MSGRPALRFSPRLRAIALALLVSSALLVATTLLVSTVSAHEPPLRVGEAPASAHDLPPVPVDELEARALTPSWDTGVLMAACGEGHRPVWQSTRFCLGGVVDALFFRSSASSVAFGGYAQLSTSGFKDFRSSLGAATFLPLKGWLGLGLRAGGLLKVSGEGAAPGAEAFVELGQRSFSLNQRYSLSHSLLLGAQWNAAVGAQEAGTTLWLGLRFDGFWLSLPALLFQ